MDSVGYCRIRMWNRIEKINGNRIRMYLLYYHIKFKYRYGYPYCYLNRYGYRIIQISIIHFPSLKRLLVAALESICLDGGLPVSCLASAVWMQPWATARSRQWTQAQASKYEHLAGNNCCLAANQVLNIQRLVSH